MERKKRLTKGPNGARRAVWAHEREREKNSPRPQMTRLASFGPVFVVIAFHVVVILDYDLYA